MTSQPSMPALSKMLQAHLGSNVSGEDPTRPAPTVLAGMEHLLWGVEAPLDELNRYVKTTIVDVAARKHREVHGGANAPSVILCVCPKTREEKHPRLRKPSPEETALITKHKLDKKASGTAVFITSQAIAARHGPKLMATVRPDVVIMPTQGCSSLVADWIDEVWIIAYYSGLHRPRVSFLGKSLRHCAVALREPEREDTTDEISSDAEEFVRPAKRVRFQLD